jgi:LuxR family quorum-sensing system transcriptional regulator CciR
MVKILSLFTDAKDISSLSDSLGDAVLPLGFPCYAVTRIALTCYRSRPSISMEAICTHYPNNWVQHYLQHNYGAVDPVHRAAFTSSGPYRWADITDLSQNERHVLAEACDAGLKNGLSIPFVRLEAVFCSSTCRVRHPVSIQDEAAARERNQQSISFGAGSTRPSSSE